MAVTVTTDAVEVKIYEASQSKIVIYIKSKNGTKINIDKIESGVKIIAERTC